MKVPHGGDIWSVARSLGLDPGELMDFSASVMPLGLSSSARERITDSIAMVSNYPDPAAHELIELLSGYHGIEIDNIAVGNGSIELLSMIPRLVQPRPRHALIVEPAFGEYARSLEFAGCKVESFQTREADSFRVDIDALSARIKDGAFDILYMANPANPTGVLTSTGGMERIVEAAEVAGTYFVVDEAFCDFTEQASIKKLAAESGRLVVVRSMTKFFGLAGLRLGFTVASKHFVEKIKDVIVPWSINSPAMAAGCASLKDSAFVERIMQWFVEEHAFMEGALASIDGVRFFNSSANFFMLKIDPPVITAMTLKDRLLQDRIIIRTLTEFSGLGENFVRVAVRTREENVFLIERLKAALGEFANRSELS